MAKKDTIFCYLCCFLIGIQTIDLIDDNSQVDKQNESHYLAKKEEDTFGKTVFAFLAISYALILILKVVKNPLSWKNLIIIAIFITTVLYNAVILVPQQYPDQGYELYDTLERILNVSRGCHIWIILIMFLSLYLQKGEEELVVEGEEPKPNKPM